MTHYEHALMSVRKFENDVVISTNQIEYDPFNKVMQRVRD